ncbi:MAG: hypothetical protein ABIP39_02920 [Polyangiaceae bacterium]
MIDWKKELRDPRTLVLAGFALATVIGCTWGLPGSTAWVADSISPRSCGLGAVVENFIPGHFQHYPPLHMALLTIVSLPWMAAAAAHVGVANIDALGLELIKPVYMTGIEASARLVAGLMALGIVWNTMRLWTRISTERAGIAAGVIVATNAAFVFYAHTGNLEVPYLFWITWALVEIDRVATGEARERQVLLLAVAATLTKDQAAGALLFPIPLYLMLVPWLTRRTPIVRKSLVIAGLTAIVAYGFGSGAFVNPSGFEKRVHMMLGPAAHTWAAYPKTMDGNLALARDTLKATTEFTSWPIALAAAIGLGLVLGSRQGLARWRALLPMIAASSFYVFFNYSARRTDTRFLLPESMLFFPYAAIAFDRAWTWRPSTERLVALLGVLALVPAVIGVASMDATLLADPRYEAERFLAALPQTTKLEIYGGPIFLPRIPEHLKAVRPGADPISERQQILGVEDIVDPAMDARPRKPDVILLATELSSTEATEPAGPHPYGIMQYRDPVSRLFFRGLLDGSLGYRRALRATCSLPWPLECRSIHFSTAGEMWVYVPAT